MPYLNCPSCRLTVYEAPSEKQLKACPRCGGRLGGTARLFRQVLTLQRSIAGARSQGPDRPATGG